MNDRPFKLPVEVGVEPASTIDLHQYAPPYVRRSNRLNWFAADVLDMKYEDVQTIQLEAPAIDWHQLYLWAKARHRDRG
jgi:hypothetical protein